MLQLKARTLFLKACYFTPLVLRSFVRRVPSSQVGTSLLSISSFPYPLVFLLSDVLGKDQSDTFGLDVPIGTIYHSYTAKGEEVHKKYRGSAAKPQITKVEFKKAGEAQERTSSSRGGNVNLGVSTPVGVRIVSLIFSLEAFFGPYVPFVFLVFPLVFSEGRRSRQGAKAGHGRCASDTSKRSHRGYVVRAKRHSADRDV